MTSRDNVTSTFGRTSDGRIADTGRPEPGQRVAEWLLQEVRDDRGNITVYEYKSEDLAGVDPGSVYERNRLDVTPTGRYLKRVRYGNQRPTPRRRPVSSSCSTTASTMNTPAGYPDDRTTNITTLATPCLPASHQKRGLLSERESSEVS